MKKESTTPKREYLTAVSIEKGIITVIGPNGNIFFCRQRNIQKLPPAVIAEEIQCGRLDPRWEKAPELPKNWSIKFEEPSVQGRALATYPAYLELQRRAHGK